MTGRRCRRLGPAKAFTLIEVLAVAAIAAIVMSLASAGLHAIASTTELLRTKAGFIELDTRGRMLARASGEAIVLEIDSESRIVRLMGSDSNEQLAMVEVPRGIGLTIERPSKLKCVRFDRRGTSVDYAIELLEITGGVRLNVAGLTGEIVESAVTP